MTTEAILLVPVFLLGILVGISIRRNVLEKSTRYVKKPKFKSSKLKALEFDESAHYHEN